jgi:hypothetical protein
VLLALLFASTSRAPRYLGFGAVLFPVAALLGAAVAAFCLRATWRFTESHVRRRTRLGRLLSLLDDRPGAERGAVGAFVQRHRSAERAQIPVQELHRAAAVFFVGQALFFLGCGFAAASPAGRLMSAGLVLALFLSVVVSAYGAVRWWAEERKLAWFAGALGAWVALAAAFPYRHTLTGLDAEYDSPVPITVRPPANPALLGGADTLAAWAREGRRPLVVLAVDGGGIRAATWTVALLATLEKDLPRFPYHVRVIAGASGGMVGAAYYVATLQRAEGPAVHAAAGGRRLDFDAMVDAISRDSLEPTTRRLVFRDISPVVWRAYADRGFALERQWERNTGTMDQPLADLAAGEAEGWRPSLVFSPTIVEDGRRLFVSNLDLDVLTRAEVSGAAGPPVPAAVSGLELARLVPAARNLHVSTVARMSASFPYVTPAAEIPTRPLRRVVDAGYYDEHGVAVAAAWIWAHRAELRQHASRVALIQVPDQRTEPDRLPNPCARRWWSRGLSDLLSPPQAVLAGWSGAMNFRDHEAVARVGAVLGAEDPDFFRTFVFEPYDPVAVPSALFRPSPDWEDCAERYCAAVEEHRPVALSWTMTGAHREELRRTSPNTAANCATRRALVRWFSGADAGVPAGCRDPVEPAPDLCAAAR